MHPMREHLRNIVEKKQKNMKDRSKAKVLQEGQDVYNFAGSAGFKILLRDVQTELDSLTKRFFSASAKATDIKELQIEGKCWEKILKKLNGYVTRRKVAHIKEQQKEEDESNL